MKKIIITILAAFTLFSGSIFAQEANESQTNNEGWKFSLISDFCLNFGSDFKTGDDHFSPMTSPFAGFGNVETFHAKRTIATPLSEFPLLAMANVTFDLSAELTIMSLKPRVEVKFMPLPFLIFGAGSSIGTCWNYPGIFEALGTLNTTTGEYDSCTSFSRFCYEFFINGTFQFDLGALVPGDWTHILLLATYQVYYKGLTGADKGDIWMFQGGMTQANGWQYYGQVILGYHFPKAIELAGVMATFSGHYDEDDFGSYGKTFGGDFMTIEFSPIVEIANEKNVFDILFTISSRQSFKEPIKEYKNWPFGTQVGREWYFKSLVVSWTHKFN